MSVVTHRRWYLPITCFPSKPDWCLSPQLPHNAIPAVSCRWHHSPGSERINSYTSSTFHLVGSQGRKCWGSRGSSRPRRSSWSGPVSLGGPGGPELATERGEGGSSKLDMSEQGLDSPWLGWDGMGDEMEPLCVCWGVDSFCTTKRTTTKLQFHNTHNTSTQVSGAIPTLLYCIFTSSLD